MKRLFITILILLNVSSIVYGEDINGIKCGTNISELKHLEVEYITTTFETKWYKDKKNETKFGTVEPATSNYIFCRDEYYGKVYSIVGKDNINEVLRYFIKEIEHIYEKIPDKKIFAHPIKRKDGSFVFLEPEKAIIVRRFSLHLGQVSVLCRDLWEKFTDFYIY